MHIHIYVKLGFWQRLGIALTLISATGLIFFIIRHAPTQADVFPCLAQIENIKTTTTQPQVILEKCKTEIITSAVKVQQLSFTVKSILIWLGTVFAIYGLCLGVFWVWTGKTK
ncbi:hypothetical protein GHU26_06610 [Pseudomonas aeruginosa]|nr:hypothetical protein [Pseudomonas aeruginosa]